MLKNEGFRWDEKVEEALERLKKAMSEAPTLGLPDFSKPFTLETNASSTGVGVVLSQEGRPLAFISKALSPRHQRLSVYDKELMAVLIVVDKWRHYL